MKYIGLFIISFCTGNILVASQQQNNKREKLTTFEKEYRRQRQCENIEQETILGVLLAEKVMGLTVSREEFLKIQVLVQDCHNQYGNRYFKGTNKQ